MAQNPNGQFQPPPNPMGYGYGYRQSGVGQTPPPPGGISAQQAVVNQNVQQGQPQPAMGQKMPPPNTQSYEALVQALVAQQAGEQAARFRQRAGGAFQQRDTGKAALFGGLNSLLANRQEGKATDAAREAARLESAAAQQSIDAVAATIKRYVPGVDDATAAQLAQAVKAGAVSIKDLIPEAPDVPAEVTNREARAEFLRNNPEIVKRIGQPAADKFYLTGNWSDAKGSSLEISPDGTIRFSENGNPMSTMDLTTTGKTNLQGDLMAAEEALQSLTQLSSTGKSGYLTNLGRVKEWAGGKLDRSGMSDSELAQYAAERRAWANRVGEEVLRYRKEVTGVAGSVQEMARIEAIKANTEMGPEMFARAIESEINAARADANLKRVQLGMEPIQFEPYRFTFGGDEQQGVDDLMELYPPKE